MIIPILKFICLIAGIAYTFVTVARVVTDRSVWSSDVLVMSTAWAGFIMLQWIL